MSNRINIYNLGCSKDARDHGEIEKESFNEDEIENSKCTLESSTDHSSNEDSFEYNSEEETEIFKDSDWVSSNDGEIVTDEIKKDKYWWPGDSDEYSSVRIEMRNLRYVHVLCIYSLIHHYLGIARDRVNVWYIRSKYLETEPLC